MSVLLDAQCVGGAVLHGELDRGPLVVGGLGLPHGELALLRHGEHLRRLALAHAVALAEVAVDDDAEAHDGPAPSSGRAPGSRRRYRATHGCASCTTIFEWSLR